jgi:hypothetical protein
MSILADFQTKMDSFVRDEAGILTETEKELHIKNAVKAYSRFRPLEKAFDIAGDGGYEFPLPADWVDGFSVPRAIEYPLGSQEPETIALEDIKLYRSPTGLKLRFLKTTLITGKTARVIYTAVHSVSNTSSTIPVSDEEAVAILAASSGCEGLANHYAQTIDPTLQADVVNYRSKSQEYGDRAKRYKKLFLETLGIKEDDLVSPASVTQDWDTNYQWGEDRIIHRRDLR